LCKNLEGFAPTKCLGHTPMSADVKREYKKTADKVEAHPWNLTRAADYLRKLVENDGKTWDALLPTIEFFTHYAPESAPMPVIDMHKFV
jgi:hypothetical protein